MKKQMKRMVRGLLAAAVVGLAGCVPQRVVWSPDGSRAAVIGGDGLHVCDVEGKLGGLLVPEVGRVAWLPDGKRVVVMREQHETNAKDVVRAYPAAERRAKELMGALKNSAGDLDKAKKALGWSDAEVSAGLIVLRDDVTSGLAASYPAVAQAAAQRTYDETVGQVYTISGDAVIPGRVMFEGPSQDTMEERVSPDGKLVAFSVGGMIAIGAVDEADGELRMLGPGCAYPDWTADSRSLLYVKPLANAVDGRAETSVSGRSQAGFATLVEQAVCGADGKLLNVADFPKAEELVGMVYGGNSRVRVAPDGRVYFTALDVTLPATPNDLDTAQVLFSIMPGKEATVSRVIPRGAQGQVGDAMEWFELSPDGKRIAASSRDGQIAVVMVGTGEVEVVQAGSKHVEDESSVELQSLPAWRGSGELTFLRPVKGGSGQEVVRHTLEDKKDVVISTMWGEEVGRGWLDKQVGGQ
ncbi:MAG TPA: hypothetical protein VHQ47_00065 [Phycisphaerae bacterium]|nr:hypothetical protein [Phycisphaerae bacterium]